ncbi:ATP-binding protein [Desulfovibrio sp. DV]|uniref:ATP-binding protein n=1 Tax=Desulfovibrio sp. DV TaxID=1844708 RepID=UPI00094BAE9E|nr:AAA family ATPase [Desulfovibrio sp. DV]
MQTQILDPVELTDCSTKIFDASGIRFEETIAADLWRKVMDHKWILSEKLGRDVGFRAACIDFLDNFEAGQDPHLGRQADLLGEMGAQYIDRDIWKTISDSQPPKQLVQKRIIRPLKEENLSKKHGVVIPKAIVFFGPPGTGKTHFVKAMAGILGWWFIEIAPSMLMAEGVDRIGANLRATMEKARRLEEAVIFIDEFEELAASRDEADRIDRSITNEFLKQVPLLKSQANKVLLVCATNYVRQLDTALLRPGRFDCIIPVGFLDDDGRRTILEYHNARINVGDIDLDLIVQKTRYFTPADLEHLYQLIAQYAFDREYETGKDFAVTTECILEKIGLVRPSLTDEVMTQFQEDVQTYSRY